MPEQTARDFGDLAHGVHRHNDENRCRTARNRTRRKASTRRRQCGLGAAEGSHPAPGATARAHPAVDVGVGFGADVAAGEQVLQGLAGAVGQFGDVAVEARPALNGRTGGRAVRSTWGSEEKSMSALSSCTADGIRAFTRARGYVRQPAPH